MQASSGRRADPLLLALAALTAVLVPWFLVRPGGRTTSWIVQTGLDVLVFALSARLFVASAGDRHARRFWRTVTVACVSCTVGDAYQTALVVTRPEQTQTSVVQTGFVVVGMGAIMVAMLSHPLGGRGRQRLRLWMDSATVLAAIAVGLWYFTLADALTSGESARQWAAAAVSAVMLLISFGVVKLLLSGTAPFAFGPGVLGAVGVAGTAVAASLPAGLDPGVAILISLCPCLIMSITLRMQEIRNLRDGAAHATAGSRRASRLPYLAVIATQVLLVIALATGADRARMWGVAGGTVLVTGLVLARQVAAIGDNERLLRELEGLHDELRHQAGHDALTGLANRAHLEQRLRALPGDENLDILLIDLDGFKPVNDRYGHAAGDEVLVAVAARLAALVDEPGVAGRLGGDEFAVLLPGGLRGDKAGGDKAGQAGGGVAALAALAGTTLSEPIRLADGTVVAVGASVGVASGPARNATGLLRDADAAMYRVKAARKAPLLAS